MIKGFVFDLDGVIADTAKYHYLAWKQIAGKIGITIDLDFNKQLKGISRMDSLESILEYGGQENKYTLQEKETMAHEKNSEYVKLLQHLTSKDLLPGVAEFLSEAKKREIPCVIASASKNAPFILKKLGVYDDFNGIVDLEKLLEGKPSPEIFLKAVEMIGIKPEEAIGFEDALAGISGIKKAGMFAVGIVTNEKLEHADIMVKDLRELSIEKLIHQ